VKRYFSILALVGCAGSGFGGDDGNNLDAGTSSDAGTNMCVIAYDPIDPVASPVLPIRAYTTVLNPQGFVTYQWTVFFNNSTPVAFETAASDGSQISFIAANPGPYQVHVNISGSPMCPDAQTTINVAAPGAQTDVFRLRTVPSPSLAPPQETFIQVKGGANADRAIALDSGIATVGVVMSSVTNAGIPAYLKFMPRSMPTAYTEQFSTSTGGYSLRLLPLDHDVLVIPGVAGLAPKLVQWTALPLTQSLTVGTGTLVNGIVRNPAGVGFSGAKVQLYAGGVPSTLGTTAPDGSFSVRADFPSTATQVTVKVTPPAGTGLPRLEATSAFNLATTLSINYAPGLTTCDLANVPVRRAGTNQPNAQVTIVGALSTVAGTISGVNASNVVRVSATANGSGVLPSMLVPRGSLFAVTEVSMTDHAVTGVNTSTCSVALIDAPAMTTVNGTTRDPDTNVLSGVRIEAEPLGVLAVAGVAPIHIASSATGAFALPLAGGGRYTVRFADPQQRAAPLVAGDVSPAGVPTNALLAKALTISGAVSVLGNSNPVIGASVQVLCAGCSGLDLARPIAETATSSVSKYTIAVPDPGTM
jgi:hypothetical protein